MSEVVQRFVDQGISEGRIQGREEGRKEGRKEGQRLANIRIAKRLLHCGDSLDKVADVSELTIDEVRKIAEEIGCTPNMA